MTSLLAVLALGAAHAQVMDIESLLADDATVLTESGAQVPWGLMLGCLTVGAGALVWRRRLLTGDLPVASPAHETGLVVRSRTNLGPGCGLALVSVQVEGLEPRWLLVGTSETGPVVLQDLSEPTEVPTRQAVAEPMFAVPAAASESEQAGPRPLGRYPDQAVPDDAPPSPELLDEVMHHQAGFGRTLLMATGAAQGAGRGPWSR